MDVRPTRGTNSFIFMQVLANIFKIKGYHTQFRSWHPRQEILDPPLTFHSHVMLLSPDHRDDLEDDIFHPQVVPSLPGCP